MLSFVSLVIFHTIILESCETSWSCPVCHFWSQATEAERQGVPGLLPNPLCLGSVTAVATHKVNPAMSWSQSGAHSWPKAHVHLQSGPLVGGRVLLNHAQGV